MIPSYCIRYQINRNFLKVNRHILITVFSWIMLGFSYSVTYIYIYKHKTKYLFICFCSSLGIMRSLIGIASTSERAIVYYLKKHGQNICSGRNRHYEAAVGSARSRTAGRGEGYRRDKSPMTSRLMFCGSDHGLQTSRKWCCREWAAVGTRKT